MPNINRPDIGIYFDYDKLLWPLEVETPVGKKHKGVEVKRLEEPVEIVWVSSHGEIYRSTEKSTRPVSDQEFARIVYGAKMAVQQARESQYKELRESEGKMVEWRPDHVLFGNYNMAEDVRRPVSKQVFVKKGELYCPRHTNSRLTETWGRGEDRQRWLACSDDNCHFDVYIGT